MDTWKTVTPSVKYCYASIGSLIVSLFGSLKHMFCFIVSQGILTSRFDDYTSPSYGTEGSLQLRLKQRSKCFNLHNITFINYHK